MSWNTFGSMWAFGASFAVAVGGCDGGGGGGVDVVGGGGSDLSEVGDVGGIGTGGGGGATGEEPGTLLWEVALGNPGARPPAASDDGTIALVDGDGALHLVGPTGQEIGVAGLGAGHSGVELLLSAPVASGLEFLVGTGYQRTQGGCTQGGGLRTVPPLDALDAPLLDGTAQILDPPALRSDGTAVWSGITFKWNQFDEVCTKGFVVSTAIYEDGNSQVLDQPLRGAVIGKDGLVRGVQASNKALVAVGTGLVVAWTADLPSLESTDPAIGADDVTLVGSGKSLVAITAGGVEAWTAALPTGLDRFTAQPAIGPDGRIYAPSSALNYGGVSNRPVVVAYNSDGTEAWTFVAPPPAVTPPPGVTCGTPAVGSGGGVYVACGDRTLYALDGTSGGLRWSASGFATTSPVILPGGVLVAQGLDALRAVAGDGEDLAAGPWPRYRGSNASDGRAR